jgi:hypothetical protein
MKTGLVSTGRVRLLDIDPDLGSVLTSEEFGEARQLAVPVVTVSRYERDLRQFANSETFGGLVLEGMVLRQIRIADQTGMRLLGPGDIVSLHEAPPPFLVADASLDALPETRLALLGREFLFAASRWPKLFAGLELRKAQQADRLVAQLVICQLSRVDQRLLSLLWLLAESWGRVTPAGTALPLKLTHEALGALIGARRPTVTLALRELTERGAIVRQSEGWLLLEAPPGSTEPGEALRPPALVEEGPSSWAGTLTPAAAAEAERRANAAAHALLMNRVEQLRTQHAYNRDHFNQRLSEYATVRERCRVNRMQVASERAKRRRRGSPSS